MADEDNLYQMPQPKKESNREIGELSTEIKSLACAFRDFRDEIRRGRDEDKKWRDLHDGQGDGTTHSKIWKEIDSTKDNISNIKANASFFGAIGGAISAALSSIGIHLFGPKGGG